jgi:hypothetical protein
MGGGGRNNIRFLFTHSLTFSAYFFIWHTHTHTITDRHNLCLYLLFLPPHTYTHTHVYTFLPSLLLRSISSTHWQKAQMHQRSNLCATDIVLFHQQNSYQLYQHKKLEAMLNFYAVHCICQ